MESVELKTITDIFDNVNAENMERFLKDFVLYTNYIIECKKKFPELKVESMIWTDDDINKITGVKCGDIDITFD